MTEVIELVDVSARFGIDAARSRHDQLESASPDLPSNLGLIAFRCELVLPNRRFVGLRTAHCGMR